MVLDYLLSPKKAYKHPWEIAVVAFLFASFGVLAQLFLPGVRASVIIFTMVPAIPLIWALLVHEEKEEEKEISVYNKWEHHLTRLISGETLANKKIKPDPSQRYTKQYSFLTHHWRLISIFAFFFLGALLGYLFWFIVMPHSTAQSVFADQLQEIENIRGYSTAIMGNVFKASAFDNLLFHNLQVLAVMFLFSLLYGIGSIYMLLWNAAVIAVVLGSKVYETGIQGVALGFVSLFPHGIFELLAYFVASIAGGLLSVALMRKAFKKPEFSFIAWDVFFLVIIALALVAVGALIESSY
ncbi:MAG: stage II sporulation protein M [Candidatus Micrarchaeota archaeon]